MTAPTFRNYVLPRAASAASAVTSKDRPGVCPHCAKRNVGPEHVIPCGEMHERLNQMRAGKRNGPKRK